MQRKFKHKFPIPFIGLEDVGNIAVLYGKKGSYSTIYQIDNPVIQYSADEHPYNDFHRLFSAILKKAGDGYGLQKQDIFFPREYDSLQGTSYIDQKNEHYFEGRKYTDLKSFLVFTGYQRREDLNKKKHFDDFLLKAKSIEQILKKSNIGSKMLNRIDVNEYLLHFLSVSYREKGIVLDDMEEVQNESCIKLGQDRIKCISMINIDEIQLPPEISPSRISRNSPIPYTEDFMSFLWNIPHTDSILYNQVISIPGQQALFQKLDLKKKRHSAIPDPVNRTAMEDIEKIQEEIEKKGETLVYCHFDIIIRLRAEYLDETNTYIENQLFNLGIIPSRNSFNQMELFRAAMPGNTESLKNYDKFLTTSDAALCFFFKERRAMDEDKIAGLKMTDREGIPVRVDLNDAPMQSGRIHNRNKFILGPSGSGKSFFMNYLLRQYHERGYDIVLIDTGHSYEGLCRYLEGKYISYSDTEPITMNPFNIKKEFFDEEKKQNLLMLILLLWKGPEAAVSDLERDIIADCLTAYYEKAFGPRHRGGRPVLCFNSFYSFALLRIKKTMEEEKVNFPINEFRFILKKFFRRGPYGDLLNYAYDNSLFETDFLVFEIDAIKGAPVKAA